MYRRNWGTGIQRHDYGILKHADKLMGRSASQKKAARPSLLPPATSDDAAGRVPRKLLGQLFGDGPAAGGAGGPFAAETVTPACAERHQYNRCHERQSWRMETKRKWNERCRAHETVYKASQPRSELWQMSFSFYHKTTAVIMCPESLHLILRCFTRFC